MNFLEIKVWMIRNRIRQIKIAQDLKCSGNLVWLTVNGKERNYRVIRWLRENGCPEEILKSSKVKHERAI